MMRRGLRTIIFVALTIALLGVTAYCAVALPLTNDSYQVLVGGMERSGNVTQSVAGMLWVPWYDRDDVCTTDHLHRGSSCDIGVVDEANNCQVSDEFSQVALLYSVGQDEAKFRQARDTIVALTARGSLMSWRAVRHDGQLIACAPGVNGNCDTASDADARLIIALLQAGANPAFGSQGEYRDLGLRMAEDFLQYDLRQECVGGICWWMAAGYQSKLGGRSSTDFAYTGYFPDGIQAMLLACAEGNSTYCAVAGNLSLNYLRAAKFDGVTLTFPPGRSFKWDAETGDAVCTNTCGPVMWDSADAPRALGFCQAWGVSLHLNLSLPQEVGEYCRLWKVEFGGDPSQMVLQYTPTGPAGSPQSGYFAQGLQSLFAFSWDPQLSDAALTNALAHFDGETWDNAACFGVYGPAFPMRALGQKLFWEEQQQRRSESVASSQPPNLVAAPPVPPEEPSLLPQQESLLRQEAFVPLMGFLMNGPSPAPTGYAADYQKEDLPAIVEDGIGTALASVVDLIGLVVLAGVLLLLANLAGRLK